jgi:phosphoribosyl-AMP cyclohydrolase
MSDFELKVDDDLLKQVKFDNQGLVPAIAQHFRTGEILMQAFMNAESLRLTLETGNATYWSRSRAKLWMKGETSGHVQKVMGILIDCDADSLILLVDQTGPACHTGQESCFYRTLARRDLAAAEEGHSCSGCGGCCG